MPAIVLQRAPFPGKQIFGISHVACRDISCEQGGMLVLSLRMFSTWAESHEWIHKVSGGYNHHWPWDKPSLSLITLCEISSDSHIERRRLKNIERCWSCFLKSPMNHNMVNFAHIWEKCQDSELPMVSGSRMELDGQVTQPSDYPPSRAPPAWLIRP